MKDALVKDLENVLREEAKVYKELYTLAQQEARLLVKNDLSSVKQIVQKQEKLILEIQTMDRVGQKILESLAVELSVAPEKINLSVLLGHLEDQGQQVFKELCEVINRQMVELNEVNQSNGVLISNALKYLKLFSVSTERDNSKTFSTDKRV